MVEAGKRRCLEGCRRPVLHAPTAVELYGADMDTTSRSGFAEEHATFLHLLGKATGNAHALEVAIGGLVAAALGVQPVPGRLVAARLGLGGSVDLLRELSTADECGVDGVQLRAWLPTAKRATEARNRVIHSPWFFNDDGPTGTLNLRQQRFTERTVEDLSADVVTMLGAIQGADSLTPDPA
jgi:hypothetical protein